MRTGKSAKARYVLTDDDRRRGGRSAASKPAPTDCETCRRKGYTTHAQHAGHCGLQGFANLYTNGDYDEAGHMLGMIGAAATDPYPENGAFNNGRRWREEIALQKKGRS